MAQLTVGLDIGTSAVRAAELDVGHSRPVLQTYGQVGLPPGSLVDGEIRDAAAVGRGDHQALEERAVLQLVGDRRYRRAPGDHP